MTYVHTHNEVLGSKQFPASGVVQKNIKPLKNSTNNNVTNKFCISSGILQLLLGAPCCLFPDPGGGNAGQKIPPSEKREEEAQKWACRGLPLFSQFYICADPCFAIFFPAFVPPLNPPFWTPTKKGKRPGGEENTERGHFLTEAEDKERK